VVAWSRLDSAGGLVLAGATVLALLWANLAPGSYRDAWTSEASWLSFTGLHLTYREWVDQAFMAVFFAVVGLEIRREVLAGELRTWRRAAAPVFAALAGMAVPALVYLAIAHGSATARGWAVPMATDVAFALGALAVFAAHASRRLRVFLMTMAVADDIASILVLVLAYRSGIEVEWLVAGVALVLAMTVVHWRGVGGLALPLALGVAAWWAVARGGGNAAVVGVAVGALALPSSPASSRRSRWAAGPRAWERRLQPVVTLVVLPAFALANAGVVFADLAFDSRDVVIVFVAVLAARLIGKPAAVAAVAWRTDDSHAGAATHAGLGAAAAVGFTVPLLVVRAAFGQSPVADGAVAALLLSTAVAAGLTAALFASTARASRLAA
jgi:NhaA family Na+:H+ antiporter